MESFQRVVGNVLTNGYQCSQTLQATFMTMLPESLVEIETEMSKLMENACNYGIRTMQIFI